MWAKSRCKEDYNEVGELREIDGECRRKKLTRGGLRVES